jgi:penicillin amidase
VRAALPAALAAAWRQAAQTAEAAAPAPASPAGWRWDTSHRATSARVMAGQQVPDPVGMAGDADTIQAAAYGWQAGSRFDVTLLSVYRQVVDLASPGTASFVIPGGAAADPGGPHFADQLPRWARHQRVPMLFHWPDVVAAERSRTELRRG